MQTITFKGIKVSELKLACERLEQNGMGNKIVLITTDDEGNGYHTLWYLFNDNEEEIQACAEAGLFQDENDPKDVVLLG